LLSGRSPSAFDLLLDSVPMISLPSRGYCFEAAAPKREQSPFLYFSRKSGSDVITGSAHFPKLRNMPSP
jgi:hypothetical protein